jgi:hypothetical protein
MIERARKKLLDLEDRTGKAVHDSRRRAVRDRTRTRGRQLVATP